MSPSKRRRRSCTRKIAHVTRASAEVHAAELTAKGDAAFVYSCDYVSGHWHVARKVPGYRRLHGNSLTPQELAELEAELVTTVAGRDAK